MQGGLKTRLKCFGLVPAPRIFTKLLKIPIAIVRRIKIRLIIYLGDMLLISQTINGLEIARDKLIFLLQGLIFVINLQISILVPLQRVSRVENKINTTSGKSKKSETEMQKAHYKPQNGTIGSDQPCRFSLFDGTGSANSYATNQFFTTKANSSYQKQSFLPVCHIFEPGLDSETSIVVQQPWYPFPGQHVRADWASKNFQDSRK